MGVKVRYTPARGAEWLAAAINACRTIRPVVLLKQTKASVWPQAYEDYRLIVVVATYQYMQHVYHTVHQLAACMYLE